MDSAAQAGAAAQQTSDANWKELCDTGPGDDMQRNKPVQLQTTFESHL